jgi:hypothetical protein
MKKLITIITIFVFSIIIAEPKSKTNLKKIEQKKTKNRKSQTNKKS